MDSEEVCKNFISLLHYDNGFCQIRIFNQHYVKKYRSPRKCVRPRQ